jgi:predicted kinase
VSKSQSVTPILVVFGGLPGVGKTELARTLAGQLGATYIRIDSIEQALRRADSVSGPMDDSGYLIGYALAEDNLRLGRTVVADCVNPLSLTRDTWLGVAKRAGVRAVEIEVLCSDPIEHRRRVEQRTSDIEGLHLITWGEVVSREYHPWTREHIVVDTAKMSVESGLWSIFEQLRRMGVSPAKKNLPG